MFDGLAAPSAVTGILTRSRPLSSGIVLVMASVLAMQSGQALAKLGFALTAPLTLTALRFGLGALVLLVVFRPRIPTDSRTLVTVLALGTSLAGTNLLIYESAARIPLGLAVTVQFLGALSVALAGSRRLRHAVWALLATTGILLIPDSTNSGALSGAGLAYAAGSAVCWGAYIVLAARVGARTSGGDGLTLATTWAALLTVPLAAVAHPRAFLDPAVLAAGLGIALLCTVLANSLEMGALRRIPPRVFGILVSLEPAVAAAAGFLLLDEQLSAQRWLAIAAIVTASIGVITDTSATRHARRPIRAQRRARTRGTGLSDDSAA